MAKLDPRRLGAFLADPGACRVVLFYGEDAGLVRERADAVVQAVTEGDALRLVELGREAAKDTGLLAAEAATMALIGGRRAVRVREANNTFTNAAKEALAGPGPGIVVLEAGELQASGSLRKLMEAAPAPAGLILPCYRERGAELSASIGRALQELGITAEAGALDWLSQRLGEDRALMRRELEKLALYVGKGGKATQDDVLACIAEGSALDLEEALMAATAGDVQNTDKALATAFAEGASAVAVVRQTLRHVQRLHMASLAVQNGASAQDAVGAMRPPIFFRHKPAFERALRLWSATALEAAGNALLEAERRTKTTGLPDAVIARGVVLTLARQAAARR